MTKVSGRTGRMPVELATAVAVLVGTVVGLAEPTVQMRNLGASGEIPSWLVLGYLPIPAGSNTWSQTLDADLLAAVGGETGVQPAGGQTVRLGNANWTWQVAHVVPRGMARLNARFDWLPLFDGPAGKPMKNTAAYLACTLVSPAATQVRLLLGSNDSVKVLLNGIVLHRFVGQRSVVDDDDDIPLLLKAGPNRLLVRVDNYSAHGGLACRLIDSKGAPPPSVTVQVAAATNAPALPQPLAAVKPWSELTAEIPPLSPAADEGQFGRGSAGPWPCWKPASSRGAPCGSSSTASPSPPNHGPGCSSSACASAIPKRSFRPKTSRSAAGPCRP